MRFEVRSLRSEASTVPLNHCCCLQFSGLSWVVTVTIFKTSRHCKLLFFVKKQRTMECKKRSKGRGWESYYVNFFFGMFGFEMRAYMQKLVKFCTHTHTHTRTHTHTHIRVEAAK